MHIHCKLYTVVGSTHILASLFIQYSASFLHQNLRSLGYTTANLSIYIIK